MTKALNTSKRMSNTSEDESDNKLRQFYCTLAREVEEDQEMGSQQSTTSNLTPLTPEIIKGIYSPLTAEERLIAETKVRQAGEAGLMVPGTTSRVAFSQPNANRSYGLFVLVPTNSKYNFICSGVPNCVRTRSTHVQPAPKCHIHKGPTIGFVLAQFTDGANKKNNVILHVIVSFTYVDGDVKDKEFNATQTIMDHHVNKSHLPWKLYSKECEAAGRPTPKLLELEGRRRYFEDEDELMKVYAARQTTTLLQMLLYPDTTIKIICLNVGINFPNGAYKYLVEEMDLYGLELKIHDKLSEAAAAAINLKEDEQIPFLLQANTGERIGALLSRGKTETTVKVAALYFVSNPYIIYAGQALSQAVHGSSANPTDPVIEYKNKKPSTHPDYKIVPIGVVRKEERYKWEFHLHMCALIASLLHMPNCINPKEFTAQSHPLCINRQTNSSFVNEKSWGIIHGYLMKKFLVDVYLGPKTSGQQ